MAPGNSRRLAAGDYNKLNFHCTEQWHEMDKTCKNEVACQGSKNIVLRAKCLTTHIAGVRKNCSQAMNAIFECGQCRPQLTKAKQSCDKWMQMTCPATMTSKERMMCLIANRSKAPPSCDTAATDSFTCTTTHKIAAHCFQQEGLAAWTYCYNDIEKHCGSEKSLEGLDECMERKHYNLTASCQEAKSTLRSCVECGTSKAQVLFECHEGMKKVCASARTDAARKACYVKNYMRFSSKCRHTISQKIHTCSKYDLYTRKTYGKPHHKPVRKGKKSRSGLLKCNLEKHNMWDYCSREHHAACKGKETSHDYEICLQAKKQSFSSACQKAMDKLDVCNMRTAETSSSDTPSDSSSPFVVAIITGAMFMICLIVFAATFMHRSCCLFSGRHELANVKEMGAFGRYEEDGHRQIIL